MTTLALLQARYPQFGLACREGRAQVLFWTAWERLKRDETSVKTSRRLVCSRSRRCARSSGSAGSPLSSSHGCRKGQRSGWSAGIARRPLRCRLQPTGSIESHAGTVDMSSTNMDPAPLLTGGQWKAGTGEVISSINPANGTLSSLISTASPAEVDEAVRSADAARRAPAWRDMRPHERARLLGRISDGHRGACRGAGARADAGERQGDRRMPWAGSQRGCHLPVLRWRV